MPYGLYTKNGQKYFRRGNVIISAGRKQAYRPAFRRTTITAKPRAAPLRSRSVRQPRKKRTYTTEDIKRDRFIEPLLPELKSKDFGIAINSTSSAAQILGQFLAIAQGTDYDQRIGKNVTLKKIHIRVQIGYFPNNQINAQPTYDLYLVLDTQTNGAVAGVLDVLDNLFAWQAFPNVFNTSRFICLKHWIFTHDILLQTLANHWRVDEEITLPDIKMTYSSTTGAIGEIKTNNLLLIGGGYVLNSGVDNYNLDGKVRTYFTDP